MKATEGVAAVTVVAVGQEDIGVIDDEVERVDCRAPATSPVVTIEAGVVQWTIRIDIPATDKEKKSQHNLHPLHS